jgi:hypothetical protein
MAVPKNNTVPKFGKVRGCAGLKTLKAYCLMSNPSGVPSHEVFKFPYGARWPYIRVQLPWPDVANVAHPTDYL